MCTVHFLKAEIKQTHHPSTVIGHSISLLMKDDPNSYLQVRRAWGRQVSVSHPSSSRSPELPHSALFSYSHLMVFSATSQFPVSSQLPHVHHSYLTVPCFLTTTSRSPQRPHSALFPHSLLTFITTTS